MTKGKLMRPVFLSVDGDIKVYPKNATVEIDFVSGPAEPKKVDNLQQAKELVGKQVEYFFNLDEVVWLPNEIALVESAAGGYIGRQIRWKGNVVSVLATQEFTDMEAIQAMEQALDEHTEAETINAEEDRP